MENKAIDILLIEDNMLDAEITIRALKKNKITEGIVHLNDGELALDFLFGKGTYAGRNTENKPKLILLDLHIPKINGIEILEELKSNIATKDIPIVMLTSSKENPYVKKCYNLGVNSFIVKPLKSQDFTNTIANFTMYWMVLNQRLN